MPPSRSVETISWGSTVMAVRLSRTPREVEQHGGPFEAPMYTTGHRGAPRLRRGVPERRGAWGALRGPPSPRRLFPLVPGAERNPLGAGGRELLRPYRDERAVLPLQHVVLHARVGVLPRLVELHAPAVDGRADRHVQRQDRGAEPVEVVGLRGIEGQLQHPEA